VTVVRTETRTARLVRVTLAGDALAGMPVPDPAASVRLLLPSPGTDELVVPAWNGNEFLLPDGARPVLRTFTPWRDDPESDALAIDVVLHGAGAASEWAVRVEAGMPAAVSGPGRGSAPATGAASYLLLGDESARPGIEQVLARAPVDAAVHVVIELDDAAGELALPARAGTTVEWRLRGAGDAPGATLLDAVRAADLGDDVGIWAAGEAAGMQRIRRHLFEERGLPRPRAVIRGYWKTGSAGDSDAPPE
jgi:NADPH-dependent ferric siderophore reductase